MVSIFLKDLLHKKLKAIFHYNRKIDKENINQDTPEGKIIKAKQATYTPKRKRNDATSSSKCTTESSSSSGEENE